jgi:hypothetical protein
MNFSGCARLVELARNVDADPASIGVLSTGEACAVAWSSPSAVGGRRRGVGLANRARERALSGSLFARAGQPR